MDKINYLNRSKGEEEIVNEYYKNHKVADAFAKGVIGATVAGLVSTPIGVGVTAGVATGSAFAGAFTALPAVALFVGSGVAVAKDQSDIKNTEKITKKLIKELEDSGYSVKESTELMRYSYDGYEYPDTAEIKRYDFK